MRNICKKLADSKVMMVLTIMLLIVVYSLRIINLDQDLPAWGVAEYQPKDEGCYAMLAISEWEYGAINPVNEEDTGLEYPLYTQEHMRSNIIGNLLGIVSFHLFGDNYYGLRMPMVLIGFLNLTVLGLILLEIRKRYGKHTSAELWGIIGILLLMSHQFYFYLSSRTVEPSTLRMLFAQLTMLIWLKSKKKGKLCFFLMGSCITVSVFLVYITNVFLYLAAGLLLLLIWKTDGFKKFFQNTCAFVAGTLVLFVAAEVYYYVVWDTFAIANLFASIGVFNGVAGYEITSGGVFGVIWGLIRGAIKYFSSNFFLYSPALLSMIMLLCPVAIWSIIREKDKDIFFLIAIPVSFLLQTMVSEDYIWRKFLAVCPFVMYLIYWGALNQGKIGCLLNECKARCKAIKNKHLRIGASLIVPGYIIVSALAAMCVAAYRLQISDNGKWDFTGMDKLLILALGCLPVLIWAVMAVIAYLRDKKVSVARTVLLVGGTTLLLSLSMLYVHVWGNPTFKERDSMISLSEEYDLDGKYVMGDFVIGITLYNDLKPVMQPYTSYAARMIDDPDLVLHHYNIDSVDMRTYFDSVIFDPLSSYAADKIATIPGTLQVNGKTRDFALYKARLRSEVISEENRKFEETILRLQEELKKLEQDNEQLTADELLMRKERIAEEMSSTQQYYADYYGDRIGVILSPIYVDTYGDFRGDITVPVYGRIYGDIYGDIKAVIHGDVYGDIYGDIYIPLEGKHYGEVFGDDFT